MTSILILNGPNLNFLGKREPEIYGATTLPQIEEMCRAKAKALGVEIEFAQSNSEGALVDRIQAAFGTHDGIILNPAAYTHTSVALLDAIKAVSLPTIELHLSNVHAREEWRKTSYVSKGALGIICGFGATGYELAIEALTRHLETAR